MKREWKPGDVAKFDGELVTWTVDGEWLWLTTGRPCRRQGRPVNEARPLVVIDPEDREQVERFVQSYFSEWEKSPDSGRIARPNEPMPLPSHIDSMQAALRSLTEPPKPDEPTGLGAVVEDAAGQRWIKVVPRIGHFDWQEATADHHYSKWSGIQVVKVLSEGVTP